MTDLEKLYNDVQAPFINEEQRRIAEGKKQEAEWLKRTEEFMSKIGFLVKKFSLYISVEDERGHCYYPDEKNVFIRSRRTNGYISIYPDGRIHNCGCCNVYTTLFGTTYNTIEEFVKAVAKANA